MEAQDTEDPDPQIVETEDLDTPALAVPALSKALNCINSPEVEKEKVQPRVIQGGRNFTRLRTQTKDEILKA